MAGNVHGTVYGVYMMCWHVSFFILVFFLRTVLELRWREREGDLEGGFASVDGSGVGVTPLRAPSKSVVAESGDKNITS